MYVYSVNKINPYSVFLYYKKFGLWTGHKKIGVWASVPFAVSISLCRKEKSECSKFGIIGYRWKLASISVTTFEVYN